MIKEFKAQVGNDKKDIKTFKHISRSDFQFKYAEKVSKQPNFRFFCSADIFERLDIKYKGVFALIYYTDTQLIMDLVGQKRLIKSRKVSV